MLHRILEKRIESNRFIPFYMALSFVKLVSVLTGFVFLIKFFPENLIENIVAVFFLYISFTIVDVISIKRQIKSAGKK